MGIRSELIYKRPDGSSVKIEISVYERYGRMEYNPTIYYRGKGKRKWIPALDTNDRAYRSSTDREKYHHAKNMEHVTIAEIDQAKLAAWGEIKPKGSLTCQK